MSWQVFCDDICCSWYTEEDSKIVWKSGDLNRMILDDVNDADIMLNLAHCKAKTMVAKLVALEFIKRS